MIKALKILASLCLVCSLADAQQADCLPFNLENNFEETFHTDTECDGYALGSWQLGEYRDVGLEPPHVNSSRFITPLPAGSCSSTVQDVRFNVGGVFQAFCYLNVQEGAGVAYATFLLHDRTNDAVLGLAFLNSGVNANGWHTLTINLNADVEEGYIVFVGAASEESFLIVDSLWYLRSEDQSETCDVYETEEEDAQTDCLPFNMENNFEETFHTDTECDGYDLGSWQLGEYRDVGLEPPHVNSSRFITPLPAGSCSSTVQDVRFNVGGVFQAFCYLNVPEGAGVAYATFLLHDRTNDAVLGLAFLNSGVNANGWHTLTINLSADIQQGYILFVGAASEGSILIVDYLSYIRSEYLIETCDAYEQLFESEEDQASEEEIESEEQTESEDQSESEEPNETEEQPITEEQIESDESESEEPIETEEQPNTEEQIESEGSESEEPIETEEQPNTEEQIESDESDSEEPIETEEEPNTDEQIESEERSESEELTETEEQIESEERSESEEPIETEEQPNTEEEIESDESESEEQIETEEQPNTEEELESEERSESEEPIETDEQIESEERSESEELTETEEQIESEERSESEEPIETEEQPNTEEQIESDESESEEQIETEEQPNTEEQIESEERSESDESIDTEERPNTEEEIKSEERSESEEVIESEEQPNTEEQIESKEESETEENEDSEEEDGTGESGSFWNVLTIAGITIASAVLLLGVVALFYVLAQRRARKQVPPSLEDVEPPKSILVPQDKN